MERITGASARRLARLAGALYLIIIVGGIFALGFVPTTIIVSGNPAATAHNIQAHELLYRLGLAVHILILPLNILLAVIFYEVFNVVNRATALLVVFFTLVGTAVEGANLLTQFTPVTLLGSQYTSALTSAQVHALAYLPLDQAGIGYSIQQVIYAGYLLAAAYLVWASTFLPRIVGALLAIGALSYLVYSFANFVAPGFAAQLVPYIQLPSLVGEGSFCVVLLVTGVNAERWNRRAGAARPDTRTMAMPTF